MGDEGESSSRILVEMSEEELDGSRYASFVEDPGCGAIVTFAGVTRDTFEGRRVVRLEYEAYVPMVRLQATAFSQPREALLLTALAGPLLHQAVSVLRGICRHVLDAFGATKVAIAHRTGVCPVGHASVIIVVSAAHRRAAIDGMSYAIDELKARCEAAPVPSPHGRLARPRAPFPDVQFFLSAGCSAHLEKRVLRGRLRVEGECGRQGAEAAEQRVEAEEVSPASSVSRRLELTTTTTRKRNSAECC